MSNLKLIYLIIALSFTGCINPPNPVISPSPSETVSPSPVISVSPFPVVSQAPIISDFYKIDFGPGSKGVSDFGPGSKGIVEFGPGSKGINEFGPGSKGVSNLNFNIVLNDNLANPNLNGFSLKSTENTTQVELKRIFISIRKADIVIADLIVLPGTDRIEINTYLENGEYNLLVRADNNAEPLEYSGKLLKLDNDTELRIDLYAKDKMRENLDMAILTRPLED